MATSKDKRTISFTWEKAGEKTGKGLKSLAKGSLAVGKVLGRFGSGIYKGFTTTKED